MRRVYGREREAKKTSKVRKQSQDMSRVCARMLQHGRANKGEVGVERKATEGELREIRDNLQLRENRICMYRVVHCPACRIKPTMIVLVYTGRNGQIREYC